MGRSLEVALILVVGAVCAGCAMSNADVPALEMRPEIYRGLQHAVSGHVGCRPGEIKIYEFHHDWAHVRAVGRPDWSHNVLTWMAQCGESIYACHANGPDRACKPYVGPNGKPSVAAP